MSQRTILMLHKTKLTLWLGACFLLIFGCGREKQQKTDMPSKNRILTIELNDSEEIFLENRRVDIETLAYELEAGHSNNSWDEIHYFSGKRVLELDREVSGLLEEASTKNGIPLIMYPATGSTYEP